MLHYRNLWLAGGWLLVGIVLFLSLTPHPPKPFSFSGVDKLGHAFAYASLALWFCQIYLSLWSRIITVVLLVVMGIGVEYVQGWSGYRYFDIWDMLANSLGALFGFWLVYTRLGQLFRWSESALRKNL